MDTLAHGLWGGAAFQENGRQWRWAFLLGMMPDLCSFGPFFLTRMGDIGERWANHQFGPPDPSIIPTYVYKAYDISHSLVIWATIFGLIWAIRRKPWWPLAAWALHILCDIPTHSTHFFPTPYLWPFQTPFVNGIPWSHKWFMLWNYAGILLAYLILRRRHRRHNTGR